MVSNTTIIQAQLLDSMTTVVRSNLARVEVHIDNRRPNWADLITLRDWLKSNPASKSVNLRRLGFDRADAVLSGLVTR